MQQETHTVLVLYDFDSIQCEVLLNILECALLQEPNLCNDNDNHLVTIIRCWSALFTIHRKSEIANTLMEEAAVQFITQPKFVLLTVKTLKTLTKFYCPKSACAMCATFCCCAKRRCQKFCTLLPANLVLPTNRSDNIHWLAKTCICALAITYKTVPEFLHTYPIFYENAEFICFNEESLRNVISLAASFCTSFIADHKLSALNIAVIFYMISQAQCPVRYVIICKITYVGQNIIFLRVLIFHAANEAPIAFLSPQTSRQRNTKTWKHTTEWTNVPNNSLVVYIISNMLLSGCWI